MRALIVKFLVCVGAVPLIVFLLPLVLARYAPHIEVGVWAQSHRHAAIAGGLLGVIYIVLRPIAKLALSLFNLFTLGILYIALDACLVLLCCYLMKGTFYVASFWWALAVSIVVNALRGLLGSIFK